MYAIVVIVINFKVFYCRRELSVCVTCQFLIVIVTEDSVDKTDSFWNLYEGFTNKGTSYISN